MNRRLGGFTLIELVLSLALTGLVATVLAPLITQMAKTYLSTSTSRAIQSEVESGMARMAWEMRQIPSSAALLSIGPNQLKFQYPLGTTISYSLGDGTVLRNTDILINNATSLMFSYYDEDGKLTTIPANVRSIAMQVSALMAGDPFGHLHKSRVFLVNTGNNYSGFKVN